MATYTFNGTSQTTATFNPSVDTVILQGIAASDFIDFAQSGSNVVISTKSGTLTLTGTTIAALTNSNFVFASGGGVVRFGDTGAAVIEGTANGDIILGRTDAANTDTINGGAGDNLIFGGNGINDSADGADVINTGVGNDRIYGNGGNDQINAGSGSDTIFGGAGSDQITASVLGGQTGFYYGGGSGIDTVDALDTITVTNAGTATLYGNGGNDTLNLTQTAGNSTVYGGIGDDSVRVNIGGSTNALGNVTVYGNAGADNIQINLDATASATVFGGNGVNDSTDGGDSITVNGGSSLIYGNAGDDNITVTVNGGSTVYGGIGSDTLNVNLASSTAKALIYGGANSTVAGALNDIISVTGGGSATIFGGSSINDTADGADSIYGGTGADLIYGNAGSDSIVGGGGNDTIFGGLGDDTINVSGGGDVNVSGNDGNDTFTFGSTLNSLDTVDGGAGTNVLTFTDAGTGTGELANVTNISTITAGAAVTAVTTTDNLVAAGKSLTFNGAATTTLNFNGAAETNGTFSVTGGAGVDTIVGGAGADTIVGGTGFDVLTGGAGKDVFQFAFGDSGTAAGSTDSIIDLDLGSSVAGGMVDMIDITGSAITFIAGYTPTGGTLTGTTAANAATVADFDAAIAVMTQSTGATAGQAALFKIGSDIYLIAETGANHATFTAATDIAIKVTGVTGTLDASDLG